MNSSKKKTEVSIIEAVAEDGTTTRDVVLEGREKCRHKMSFWYIDDENNLASFTALGEVIDIIELPEPMTSQEIRSWIKTKPEPLLEYFSDPEKWNEWDRVAFELNSKAWKEA